MFFEPIEPYFKNIKTIYYCPIDEINNFSLPIFVSNPIDTTYLMDKYNLESLLSTSTLITNKNPILKNTENSISLFGGVEYNFKPLKKMEALASNMKPTNTVRNGYFDNDTRNKISYLLFTKIEVENISRLLSSKNWNVKYQLDTSATENKIKNIKPEKSPTILHFATHGFAFPESQSTTKNQLTIFEKSLNPMKRSGLMFYGANDTWIGKRDTIIKYTGEDGVLTAEEVSNIDLSSTKLVVMSACQSGLGEIKGNEGVYGLKRAFRLSGVENMIVSLWPVPDKETMELMDLFYKELVNTKDISKSFRKAQRTMRQNYPSNPWAWGGFVLVR